MRRRMLFAETSFYWFLLLVYSLEVLPVHNDSSGSFILEPSSKNPNVTFKNEHPVVVSLVEETHYAELVKINYSGAHQPIYTVEPQKSLNLTINQTDDLFWHVYIQSEVDYEQAPNLAMVTISLDELAETEYFHVSIENVNDNKPVIQLIGENCEIEENVNGTSNCSIIVRDADTLQKDKIKMMISNISEAQSSFSFNFNRQIDKYTIEFILEVQKNLDYEQRTVISMTITACDSFNGRDMESSTIFVVWVKDLPDERPYWTTVFTPTSIDEETEWSFQFLALDGDFGQNQDISYKMDWNTLEKSDEYCKFFQLNSETGLLSVAKIDYDTLKVNAFRFVVIAYETDDPNSNVTANATIFINDLNDNVPIICPESQKTSIEEGKYGVISFPNPFNVTDLDSGQNGQFILKLEKNYWSDAFQIIPGMGFEEASISISVINSTALDFENTSWQNISLQIKAVEVLNNSHSSTACALISLKNVDDEFPVFEFPLYETEVYENASSGSFVVTVKAVDPDDEDDNVTVSYFMNHKALQVDETNGNVTVKGNNSFDYEQETEILVQVIAEDRNNHRSYAQIKIQVQDINDEIPVLTMPNVRPKIKEHEENGAELDCQITASDPDKYSCLNFSIHWDSSSAAKQGAWVSDSSIFFNVLDIETKIINGNSNAIVKVKNKDQLDWEKFDTLYLVIVVTDDCTHPDYMHKRDANATLIIIITDVNDNFPEFTENTINSNNSVEENSPEGKLIGRVVATDRDGPGNNNITYGIKPLYNLPNGMVVIDVTSGELRTGHYNIDCEEYEEHYYNISASDGNNTAYLKITIKIIDVNDNIPEVMCDKFNSTVEVYENTGNSSLNLFVVAEDKDVYLPFKEVTYLLKMDNTENSLYFSINNISGEMFISLKDRAELDRETKDRYDVTVLMRDNFADGIIVNSKVNETTITIILLDVNDNGPVFKKMEGCQTNLITEENKMGSTLVEEILATDDDIGENKKIIYVKKSIISDTPGRNTSIVNDLFEVETVSEETGLAKIIAKQDLKNFWGNYTIEIEASGLGNPAFSSVGYLKLCVADVNDNIPKIVAPKERQIYLHNKQELHGTLVSDIGTPIPDFQAVDEDDYLSGNGKVTFNVTGDANAIQHFYIWPLGDNKGRLYLKVPLDSNGILYNLEVEVKDQGTQPTSSKMTYHIIHRFLDEVAPHFPVQTQTLHFSENCTGLHEHQTITEAFDKNNNGLNSSDVQWQTIFYILSGSDKSYFQLNKTNRVLSLIKQLDYETQTNYSFYVEAYNHIPDDHPSQQSLLHVTIQVDDVNDMPPVFRQQQFTGGFFTNDDHGKVILEIRADDPDTNDPVRYSMLKHTLTASDESLESIKDKAFDFVDETGAISLGFSPANGDFKGYFSFQVEARDTMKPPNEDHMDVAEVRIYIISEKSRVTFKFQNPYDIIKDEESEVVGIFSEVFQYKCGIESVKRATDSINVPSKTQTDVIVHFINNDTEPISNKEITDKLFDNEIFFDLQTRLRKAGLNLLEYEGDSEPHGESLGDYIQVVLICLSAVLGVMVVVLFITFFVRTRTLNRRLEKLSSTKFGSQESGLNRIGVIVPNTNRHAVEGSNPVWNQDMNPNIDNMSQHSGDSDLIGIEDNPEFNPYANEYMNNVDTSQGTMNEDFATSHTASLNPLSNMGGDDPVTRRMSMNPLSASIENMSTSDHMPNSNFTFQKMQSLPVTEL